MVAGLDRQATYAKLAEATLAINAGCPFIGSEAVTAGQLTKYALSSRFVAIHPDVYLPRGTVPTAKRRTIARVVLRVLVVSTLPAEPTAT